MPATTEKTTSTTAAPAENKTWKSRAVIRLIDAGNAVYCGHCGEPIKFRARVRAYQIICNVYIKNVWDRVEHYHEECYAEADSPYGEPQD